MLFQNENTFWANNSEKGLVLKDNTRFAVTIVIIILSFIDLLVCVICLVVGLCCAPHDEVANLDYKPKSVSLASLLRTDPSYTFIIVCLVKNDFRRTTPRKQRSARSYIDAPVVVEEGRRSRPSSSYHRDIHALSTDRPKTSDGRSEGGRSRHSRLVHHNPKHSDVKRTYFLTKNHH